MREIAYALVPLAGLFALRRVARLAVAVTTGPPWKKKRGLEDFKVRVTFKNIGDLPIENWSFHITAVSGPSNIPIASENLSLAVGETKTFPTTADYYKKTVPPEASLGIWDCLVVVVNAPVGQPGQAVASKTISNAWEVIEPVKAVEIVSVEVA
jgi:hypothetical protein